MTLTDMMSMGFASFVAGADDPIMEPDAYLSDSMEDLLGWFRFKIPRDYIVEEGLPRAVAGSVLGPKRRTTVPATLSSFTCSPGCCRLMAADVSACAAPMSRACSTAPTGRFQHASCRLSA